MRRKEGHKELDIINAAIKIFAEKGYHKSKIHKIAEIANVATGSVYVYYKNKEAILLTIFEQLWKKLYDELEIVMENPKPTPIEKFDKLIDIVFDYFTVNQKHALVFVNEQHHLMQTSKKKFTEYYDKFLDLGEKIVYEGIKNGSFNPAIDVKIIRNFIFGGIRHLVRNWAISPKEFPLESIRKTVKLFVRKGIVK